MHSTDNRLTGARIITGFIYKRIAHTPTHGHRIHTKQNTQNKKWIKRGGGGRGASGPAI